jgi:hypothetical protein
LQTIAVVVKFVVKWRRTFANEIQREAHKKGIANKTWNIKCGNMQKIEETFKVLSEFHYINKVEFNGRLDLGGIGFEA